MSDSDPESDAPADGARDPDLLDVAGSILDGAPVDWSTATASASPLIDELRALARLTAVHERLAGVDLRPPTDAAALGVWGPLRLLERVGHGTSGEVFRAWDARLDREVALKLLLGQSTPPDSLVVEEGRLLARVRHPNVVTVFGAERIDGRVGIWTEFVHGETLASIVERAGPMDAATATSIGIQVCRGLAAVHAAGIVHGDVKAHNVLRAPDGRVVLVDLGIGREPARDVEAAAPVAGTPLYLAPEVWAGRAPTPQSDIYGLGVLLYYVVSGTYPVAGATASAIRDAQAAGERMPLSERRRDLPRRFVAAVDRALAVDPADRYQAANAFAAALEKGQPARRAGARGLIAAFAPLSVAVAFAVYLGWSRPSDAGADRSQQIFARLATPDDVLILGRASHDGRYLAYVTDAGGVTLWHPSSGRRFAVEVPDEGRAQWSAASPDGDRVVYEWRQGDRPVHVRLFVADRLGGAPRLLVPAGVAGTFRPMDWSADGTHVLCWFGQGRGRQDLALVDATDGSFEILTQAVVNGTAGASLSPDGRFAVLAQYQSATDNRSDLVIVEASSQRTWPLVSYPDADDFAPVWTASGDVLFASTRGRSPGLFVQSVSDGRPAGPAVSVAPNVHVRDVQGLSREGVLFVAVQKPADVFLAALDTTAAMPIGTPQPVDPAEIGDHTAGNWSDDGTRYGYVDRRGGRFVVQDATSGTKRIVNSKVHPLNDVRFSPDSRQFLFRGAAHPAFPGAFLFHIDLNTEVVRPVAVQLEGFQQFEWWPDSRGFRYRHAKRGLVDHDLDTGDETIAIPAALMSGTPAGWGMLRDGKILVASQIDEAVVFRLFESGAPRELMRVPRPARFSGWLPDDRAFLYTRQRAPGDPFHLWVMPLTGHGDRDLGPLPGYTLSNPRVALRPDGREISYIQGTFGEELWSLTRFLPAARGSDDR
jgi:Tol biopolymer transport system component